MIIICHTEPGYSNQLFQNAYALAFAKDNKSSFYNCTNRDWKKYYHLRFQLLKPIIKLLSKWRYKIPLTWQSKFKIGYIDFSDEESASANYGLLKKHNIVFLSGWYFRHSLLQYRSCFKKTYTLRKKYYQKNHLYRMLLNLKRENYTVYGIHARRGDYQFWEGGKYYFDWSVYAEKKLQIRDFYNSGAKVKFIIFSNEKVPESIIDTDTIISKEAWYLDHHLMGMCDYLLGPPSTFTMWASFIGGAKLSFLKSAEQKIEISDFEDYYGK